MAGSYAIDYIYRISDRFSPILNKMAQGMTRFDAGVTRMQSKLGGLQQKFQATGARMANLQTGLASLGAGAFLKSALSDAVAFGDGMARIGTLIPGQRQRLDELGGSIQELAIRMGKNVNDISGGAFDVISAFGDLEGETEGRLKAVAEAAVAGGSTTSEALSLLSAVTKSYGDTSAEALTKASDLAFMTNVLGQTTFPEMAASMGKLLPLTAQMAVSQEEVFASMASLTGVTGSTSEVTTQLAAMMSALIKPTTDMQSTIKGLGFASAKAMLQEKGLSGTLELLAEKTNGSEEAVGKLFGSKEAMTAFFALSGAQADKFSESLDAMGSAAVSNGKVTEDALLEMMDSPGYQLGQMTSAFQTLKIAMGDIVADSIKPLLDKFIPFVTSLKESNPQLLKMITYFLMATTALGAILIPLGLLISAIGSIIGAVKVIIGLTKLWTAVQVAFNAVMAMNPIAMIIIGIIALIAIIVLAVKHWDKIKAAAISAWEWIKEKTMQAIEAIKGFIQGLWEKFSTLLDNPFFTTAALLFAPWLTIPALILKHWEPIKAFFIGLWEKLQPIIEGVGGFFRGVGDFFTGGGEGGASAYSARSPEAPSPGRMRGMNAEANASVSVYTEQGMGVKPFESSGNLGYNMSGTSRRR